MSLSDCQTLYQQYAARHSAITGIPASFYIALLAAENTCTSGGQIQYNNPFDLAGNYGFGTWNSSNSGAPAFAIFPSIDAAFTAFDKLITSGQYSSGYQLFLKSGNIQDLVDGMAQGGYAGADNQGGNGPTAVEDWIRNLLSLFSQAGGGTSGTPSNSTTEKLGVSIPGVSDIWSGLASALGVKSLTTAFKTAGIFSVGMVAIAIGGLIIAAPSLYTNVVNPVVSGSTDAVKHEVRLNTKRSVTKKIRNS